MITLGIETSCDETSIAILQDGVLKANIISSQEFHKDYGGVVPELSSRAHLQLVLPLLRKALSQSEIELKEIDLIAATAGPGLIGPLLVGLSFGKSLAYSLKKDFIAVNHIEGHIYSGFLMNEKPNFPYLCLVVSGGHTLALLVESESEIIKLGGTIDDAIGEAFDKVAKLLGLGYPGGPLIQKFSEEGDPKFTAFPIAQLDNRYDFSFSGIKTSVLRFIENNYKSSEIMNLAEKENVAAAFQKAAIEPLLRTIRNATEEFDVKSVCIVGGVAANKKLREEVEMLGEQRSLKVVIPKMEFCGDNAAMIALRGQMLYKNGVRHDLNENAFPRNPINLFRQRPGLV
ncbi:MAG: tRNA (adenosine(37)-N6)-threonylcarbamoyltransferase complex transferase subunit TsaD [Melioribacteraceae bacterium]|nr:tRNA (adenosine(37)-N6)-threonylcarbamoyltransferase complex transferase subunit TsaD [Melioribacteraceae bacterium]MCF8264033.1 tRNA (adenosine(37)-N6)-threonylcarbamoyltransferase complex transferase subunit TsaD [Melioribacteraceae bacterium]